MPVSMFFDLITVNKRNNALKYFCLTLNEEMVSIFLVREDMYHFLIESVIHLMVNIVFKVFPLARGYFQLRSLFALVFSCQSKNYV